MKQKLATKETKMVKWDANTSIGFEVVSTGNGEVPIKPKDEPKESKWPWLIGGMAALGLVVRGKKGKRGGK